MVREEESGGRSGMEGDGMGVRDRGEGSHVRFVVPLFETFRSPCVAMCGLEIEAAKFSLHVYNVDNHLVGDFAVQRGLKP